MEKKVYLRTDFAKKDGLSDEAIRFCRLVNDRIIPSLMSLDMYDKAKVFYYAEDSDRVYDDFMSKNLKGIEKASPYLRKIAKECANDELINTIGDGWGKPCISKDALDVCEWRMTENGEQLCIDNSKLEELCKVYVLDDEMGTYSTLQAICNQLNDMTIRKGLRGYEHIIFCPNGGEWQVNGNINLKAFK